ncbi:MAG: Rpn family recombination-promoting nuclease/putative transposase [Synechococcales bacterium]|nr:Rpn family recombination-promoting nuclease/putative transposase [Synechococcales bacterium]
MRRDSIFYALFRQSPALLFELLDEVPASAAEYRFESVAVKEPKFEIDGVFLPPESDPPQTIFFAEFQMQKDEELYERLFSEVFLYFRQNRSRFSTWQAVLIYKSRSTEQSNTDPYQALLNSSQVHRCYLNELGAIDTLPLGLATLKLTIASRRDTVEQAKRILERAQTELPPSSNQQGIIDLVSAVVTYQFATLSRQEVNEMLGISLEQTRVYQEAREEGRQEGRQEGTLDTMRSIALNLLREQISVETIARTTGLSIAQIEALQTRMNEEL